MDLRLHGLPAALLRRVRAKAETEGRSLRDVLIGLLSSYVDGSPVARAGGHARAASLSPERRQAIARTAAVTRWQGRDAPPDP